ncbi:MAG: divalent-cation tolerance protein CutA [Saprospiraceae bacterium]
MEIFEVQVTYPNEASARKAADHLLRKHLVACVNFNAIQSIYWWNNELQEDNEFIAHFKTLTSHLQILLDEIKSTHPYHVPAILYWKVNTSAEYYQWVEEVVNPGKAE